jgi:hypothetical protein
MLTCAGLMLMKSFKNFSSPLRIALLAAPLLITACADNGPWAMPTGYTYEHNVYKAPPGPKPVYKKWEFSHGMRQEQPLPPGAEPMSTHLEDMTTTTTTVTAVTPVEASADIPGVAAVPALTISDMPAPMMTGPDSWDRAAKDLIAKLITDFGHPTEAIWLQADPSASDSAMNFDKALRAAMMMHQIHIAAAPGAGPYVLHYSVAPSSPGRSMLMITLMAGPAKAAEESGMYDIPTGVSAMAPQALAPQEGMSATTNAAPSEPGVPYTGREDHVTRATMQNHTGMADDVEPGLTHGDIYHDPYRDRHVNE